MPEVLDYHRPAPVQRTLPQYSLSAFISLACASAATISFSMAVAHRLTQDPPPSEWSTAVVGWAFVGLVFGCIAAVVPHKKRTFARAGMLINTLLIIGGIPDRWSSAIGPPLQRASFAIPARRGSLNSPLNRANGLVDFSPQRRRELLRCCRRTRRSGGLPGRSRRS